ncbi:hypothetical protein AEAC466_10245 [Asticcacaulis sp. AC466]|uniref:hypothetical protein n=1 Tax=Asticcacaulis sp. AC466 TaxID=1282362 RepID=UPI0003C3C406|nr:hypothetical protein [Asticcacaulis sp. AC466]ESQ84117.1 hypothetical protein AEAC466_10245 [Asticcacaulis sp. AC466]
MIHTAHPSTYSLYWEAKAEHRRRPPYALLISLAAAVLAIFTSGSVVATQLNRLPDPDQIAIKNIDTGTPPTGYDTTVTPLPAVTRLAAN